MNGEMFQVGADGVDVSAVVEAVRARVEEKKRQGAYADPRVARAEWTNLDALKDDDTFLSFYLECLRDAVYVDISDFEIRERRRRAGAAFVALKRAIWNLLKFYTYRLWSQQNQVNGLVLSAVEAVENKYRGRLEGLEARVAKIEQGGAAAEQP